MKSPHSAARVLAMLAQTQGGGYFTAKQAASVGYGYRHLDYHEAVGNFERIAHGLYRLPTVPVDEHDDLIRLTFWSRNQKDAPQAVVSHESALALTLESEIHSLVSRSYLLETTYLSSLASPQPWRELSQEHSSLPRRCMRTRSRGRIDSTLEQRTLLTSYS